MLISSDNIGNRTRDFGACSAVPQLTAPPRAPRSSISSSGNNSSRIIIVVLVVVVAVVVAVVFVIEVVVFVQD